MGVNVVLDILRALIKALGLDTSGTRPRGGSGQRPGARGGSGRPGSSRPGSARPGSGRPASGAGGSRPASTGTGEAPSPGQSGPSATVEVDPRRVGPVEMAYVPHTDGDADPGEVIWTWVPFEENDGRGKDRPVLVIARLGGGEVLAIQLTSKSHGGESDFLPLGAGPWDSRGRESWANLDRVFRVSPGGMRREASSLDRAGFERVTAELRRRFGWR